MQKEEMIKIAMELGRNDIVDALKSTTHFPPEARRIVDAQIKTIQDLALKPTAENIKMVEQSIKNMEVFPGDDYRFPDKVYERMFSAVMQIWETLMQI